MKMKLQTSRKLQKHVSDSRCRLGLRSSEVSLTSSKSKIYNNSFLLKDITPPIGKPIKLITFIEEGEDLRYLQGERQRYGGWKRNYPAAIDQHTTELGGNGTHHWDGIYITLENISFTNRLKELNKKYESASTDIGVSDRVMA